MLKEHLIYWVANPLEDIFEDTLPCHHEEHTVAVEMVRNEQEGVQIALRTNRLLENVSVRVEPFAGEGAPTAEGGFVGYVYASKNTPNVGQRAIRRKAPTRLPEYIRRNAPQDLIANQSQSYFITFTATADTKPGRYKTAAVVSAEGEALRIPVEVTVSPVLLPDPKDSESTYICWLNLAGLNGDKPEPLFRRMNREVYGIENYSPAFWKLGENYARALRRQRQNAVNVPVYALIRDSMDIDQAGVYHIDWTNFDRYCRLFVDTAQVRQLVGMHLFYRDFVFDPPKPDEWSQKPLIGWYWKKKPDGEIVLGYDFADSPAVCRHLEQFLPLLNAHLEETGLKPYWWQHVADETTSDVQQAAALMGYRLVRQYLPGVRTIDAGKAEYADCFRDELDIHTCAINSYDDNREKYDAALKIYPDLQVFTYTCMHPQMDYLSRLGDFKLICTRLIFYYNFKYHVSGFLHWAWNLWSEGAVPNRPFEEAGFGKMYMIPTDAWLVYPDVENLSVLESTRSNAVRDGLEDLELLRIAYGKAPDRVEALLNILMESATEYLMDTRAFFRFRRELIRLAEG